MVLWFLAAHELSRNVTQELATSACPPLAVRPARRLWISGSSLWLSGPVALALGPSLNCSLALTTVLSAAVLSAAVLSAAVLSAALLSVALCRCALGCCPGSYAITVVSGWG